MADEKQERTSKSSKTIDTTLHIIAKSTSPCAFYLARDLLKNGADPNLKDPNNNGVTPCHIAAEKNNYEMFRLLLRNGGDLNSKSKDKRTVKEFISPNASYKLMQLALSNKEIKALRKKSDKKNANKCQSEIPLEKLHLEDSVIDQFLEEFELHDHRNSLKQIISDENNEIDQAILDECKNITNYNELPKFGLDVGPITDDSKILYIRRLASWKTLKNKRLENEYFKNLFESLDDNVCRNDEEQLRSSVIKPGRKWRAGNRSGVSEEIIKKSEYLLKNSYCYLYMEPLVINNLRMESENDHLQIFIENIFYVGQGQGSRLADHLKIASDPAIEDLVEEEKNKKKKKSEEINNAEHILQLFRAGRGPLILKIFPNISEIDAITREAALIDTLGLSKLKNLNHGTYYGAAVNWSYQRQQRFGAYLVKKAIETFLKGDIIRTIIMQPNTYEAASGNASLALENVEREYFKMKFEFETKNNKSLNDEVAWLKQKVALLEVKNTKLDDFIKKHLRLADPSGYVYPMSTSAFVYRGREAYSPVFPSQRFDENQPGTSSQNTYNTPYALLSHYTERSRHFAGQEDDWEQYHYMKMVAAAQPPPQRYQDN